MKEREKGEREKRRRNARARGYKEARKKIFPERKDEDRMTKKTLQY